MKYLLIFCLLSFLGCSQSHQFNSNQCFYQGFNIIKIDKTDQQFYYISSYLNFSEELKLYQGSARFKFKIFDEKIEKEGLIPTTCPNLKKE